MCVGVREKKQKKGQTEKKKEQKQRKNEKKKKGRQKNRVKIVKKIWENSTELVTTYDRFSLVR